MKKTLYTLLFSTILLHGANAGAASSGTGYFVNDSGHIITAAHVVDKCQKILVRGAVKPSPATLVSMDEKYDLAVIKTESRPQLVGALREPEGILRAGEKIYLPGYPGQQGENLNFVVRDTNVGATDIPLNQDKYFQFSDSAEHGNSGGPLVDESGNVIGMVSGFFEWARYNKTIGQKVRVKKSDAAITLNRIKTFLGQSGVYYQRGSSTRLLDRTAVSQNALHYVVHIICE